MSEKNGNGNKDIGRMLKYEANLLGRKLERRAKKLAEAANRETFRHLVIETNSDDRRGDIVSLLLNGKPEHMNQAQWFAFVEGSGGPRAGTMKNWLEPKKENGQWVNPTAASERAVLHVLGLDVFYGRRVG